MKKIDLIFAEGSLIKDFSRFIKLRKFIRKQRIFCWCPICGENLCSNKSFKQDIDLVRYECSNCGCRSSWNFDIAPAPILIKNDKIIYNKNI